MAVSMAVTMTVTPTNSTIISAPTMDTKAATNAVKHPHPLHEQPSNNIAQSPSHHIYIQYPPFYAVGADKLPRIPAQKPVVLRSL